MCRDVKKLPSDFGVCCHVQQSFYLYDMHSDFPISGKHVSFSPDRPSKQRHEE